MRVLLDKNEWLRKTRVLRELDPSGNLTLVMLKDPDKNGLMEGIVKAGRYWQTLIWRLAKGRSPRIWTTLIRLGRTERVPAFS
jgi:hypothetical protein